MIKRRFFKIDHGDRDASDPSSSSSEDDDSVAEVKQDDEVGSTSSGYESEDSSANDVDFNSAGVLSSEDDAGIINEKPMFINQELLSKCDPEKSNVLTETKPLPTDMTSYILKCKSVFKCRICPRIICLTEDTLRDHLQSKRHARSEKLHREGRLKAMLNSDGEIENQEVSEIQFQTKDNEDNAKKNNKGQKQQKKRLRKKKSDADNASTKKMLSTKGLAKRRRKNEN